MGFWKMILRGFTPEGNTGNINTHMQYLVNELEDQGHTVHNAQTVPVEEPAPATPAELITPAEAPPAQ